MRRTRIAAVVFVGVLAGCGSTVEPITSVSLAPNQQSDGGSSVLPLPTQPGSERPSSTSGAGGATSIPTSGRGSSTSSGGGNSTAPTGGSTSTGAGSSKQTGPITVGILTTATSNAGQYGASVGNTVSESGVDQAIIDALNKRGGFGGRQIKAVFASTDTGGSDWAAEFQAACATFTQDHHVDVVLGYAFDYVASFESCLAKAGIPHLSTSYNVPEEVSKYPDYWSLSTPPATQIMLAKFTGAIKTGFLTPKNKVGVILDTCSGSVGAWQRTVEPYLHAHHIATVAPFILSCGTGQNAGIAAELSQLTNALLKFRSQGVDRIGTESPVFYFAAIEAQSQGYRPGWIVSSLGGLALVGGMAPIPQMQNTRGFGWMPAQDVAPAYLPKPNAAQRRCLALLHSRNVHPRASEDFVYAYQICEAAFLYEAALKRDGGDLTASAVSGAIASIGSGFQSMLNLGGHSVFTQARRNDAPTIYKPINWDGNCHCFRYGHLTFPMPS